MVAEAALPDLRLAGIGLVALGARRDELYRRSLLARRTDVDHRGAEARIGDGIVPREPPRVEKVRQRHRVAFQHEVEVVAGRHAEGAIPQQPADKIESALIGRCAGRVTQQPDHALHALR
jgi:hypothetical protein